MPRFVLLEHRRDGVHWDFMLEAGDHLRTWALDAPIVPGVEIPARALVNHRRVYLDFQGEITGGRGTVRRVDRGSYETLDWTSSRVRVLLAGDQLVGEAALWRIGSEDGGEPEPSAWLFRLGKVD